MKAKYPLRVVLIMTYAFADAIIFGVTLINLFEGGQIGKKINE